jgi:NADH-quinone oxidoreductase subunit C
MPDDPTDAQRAEGDTTAPAPGVPEVHGCPTSQSRGQLVVHPSPEQYLDLLRALLDDGYHVCVDLCAVDYLTSESARRLPDGVGAERFEVVVNLLDMAARRRIRVRVQVPESDAVLPSTFELWPGTEAMEREVFDMFGISFEGHPDLTRILMPEDWVGHPLRKDYAVGQIPVQFSPGHADPVAGSPGQLP